MVLPPLKAMRTCGYRARPMLRTAGNGRRFHHSSYARRKAIVLRGPSKATLGNVSSRTLESFGRAERVTDTARRLSPGGFSFGRLAFSSLDRPSLLTAWHLRLVARPWVGLASVSEHPQKMRGRLQSRGSLCWSVAAAWHLLNRWWSSVRCCPA
jgi:hypothetical protein